MSTIPDVSFSTENEKLQFDVIHSYLTRSYWSEGISLERMKKAMENSLNIGAYIDNSQVGYARLITDKATFAYLCDVFVLESHQGQGIGKSMMKFMLALPELQNIKRIMLATRDAHGLYAQFGFEGIKDTAKYMQIDRSGIFKSLKE